MQSFAENIAESFYSEVPLTWNLRGLKEAAASFTTGTVSVEVTFEQKEAQGPWHVGFNVLRGDADSTARDAFRIFNGVFQAVREFAETREPERMVFIAKSEGLSGIYETYLRREKSALEDLGYQIEGPFRIDPYTQFTLRRMRPSAWKDPLE